MGIGYLEAWLRGQGCVPLYNLMEDAATAEISRAQGWQQIRHKAKFAANGNGNGGNGGTPITRTLCRKVIGEELEKMVGAQASKNGGFKSGRYKEAARLFHDLIEARKFPEFLTLPAYDWIVKNEKKMA